MSVIPSLTTDRVAPDHYFVLLRVPKETGPVAEVHDGAWILQSMRKAVTDEDVTIGNVITWLKGDAQYCATVEIPLAVPRTFSEWCALLSVVKRTLKAELENSTPKCQQAAVDAIKEFYFGAEGCPFEYYRNVTH